jgi:hypothetical protein
LLQGDHVDTTTTGPQIDDDRTFNMEPVYYELSWSILSTIGIANVLFGLMVAGITSFGPVSIVPIVTSAAGAIANGLCYYAFYDKSNTATTQAVASVFADILWLVSVFCAWNDRVLMGAFAVGTRSRPVVLQLHYFESSPARSPMDYLRRFILVHDGFRFSHSSRNRSRSSSTYHQRYRR